MDSSPLHQMLQQWVGFFLPPDLEGRWIGSGIRHLGKGAWITAPSPYRTAGRPHLLVPPDGIGTLFAPAAVEVALQKALGRSAAQARNKRWCPTCDSPAATPPSSRTATRAR